MFIWIVYIYFYSFNGFYHFHNFEIQSGYVTGSWSNQLFDPTRLCSRFIVEPGSWSNPVQPSGRSGLKTLIKTIILVIINYQN